MTLSSRLAPLALLALWPVVGRADLEEPHLARPEAASARVIQVIKITGADIYVNLSGAVGTLLDVYRQETLVDPATGTPMTGRLRIGALRIHQTGDQFSIARGAADVRVGDLVTVRQPATRPVVEDRAPTALAVAAPAAPAPAAATLVRRATRPDRGVTLRTANLGATNRLDFSGGYVSYGSNDRFGQFAGEYVHYFFHDVVHSIRFGGGGLLGEVPFVPPYDYPDQTGEPDAVRFYYGLAGIDLTLTEWLGVEMMAIFGVTEDGVGGGGLGAWRIGKRDGVNVRVGGWLRSYVGHEGFLSLEVPIGRRFKLIPRVVIDNMPRGEDMGFRALLGGELRLGRYLGLAAEVGGAARDARTGGFVGNFGLTLHL